MAEPARTSGKRTTARKESTQRVVDCLRSAGPSSQSAIARATGLSPATVNGIVAELRAEGRAEVQKRNGRETRVSLVSKAGVILAVEVSHNSVRGSAFRMAECERIDTGMLSGSSPKLVVTAVAQLAKAAGVVPADLAGVAVSVEAPIDRRTDTVASWVTNRLPQWRGVPLTSTLSRAIGTKVMVENDAHLAALAEWAWGVGRGVDDFLYVKASGGVGGGLLINGQLYHGGSGMAGAIGHVVVAPEGDVCYCGNRGCLTTLVSERAILAAVTASRAPRGSLREVIDSAIEGDPACRRVLIDAGMSLGRVVANAAKIVAPSTVAIGGTLGGAGDIVLDAVRAALEVRSLRSLAPDTRIEAATLNGDASTFGGLGAVLTALGQGLTKLPQWMETPSTVQ